MKYEVEYDSNNSGGSWWLSDEDWADLETDGWKVAWIKDDDSDWHKGQDRFLGALATSASKVYQANSRAAAEAKAAIDWADIVGQSPTEEGCSCCGQPHSFWAREVPEVKEIAA